MAGRGRIFQRGKRGTWWIAYFRRGREVRESSGSPDRRRAERLFTRRIADLEMGKAVGPATEALQFEDLWVGLVRDYRINERKSLRMLTVRHHHLAPYFAGRHATNITATTIARYVEQRRDQGGAPASINRELAALRRAFRLAVDDERLPKAPRIRLLAEHNARQGFIEHRDFLRLRSLLPDYLRGPITFLYLSGWRVSEMRTLAWSAIDLEGRIAMLRREHSKNARPRTLPLAGELWELIATALAAREPANELVFTNRGVR